MGIVRYFTVPYFPCYFRERQNERAPSWFHLVNDGDGSSGDMSGLPALPTRTNCTTLSFRDRLLYKNQVQRPFGLDNKLPQSRGQTLGYEKSWRHWNEGPYGLLTSFAGLDCNLHIYFIQCTFFSEEFLSYGYGNPSHCGTDCKFLSDGFGYWMNGSWIAHAPGKSLYPL